jgi:co-chaperonin GroES (HSP10)
MKPLKDYILLAESKSETTTESGIVLTGSAETGSKPGIVLAIGPDVKDVQVGDKVAVKWGDALAVSVDNSQAALISEESVYGIY